MDCPPKYFDHTCGDFFQVIDPQNNRFVVPGPLQPIEPSQAQRRNLKYEVEVVEDPVFGIRVTRLETGAIM